MTFAATGFQSLGVMGTPTAAAGSRRRIHTYITNDTAAQVVTSDYFLSIYQQLKVGDVILASIDTDGTPSVLTLVVTAAAAGGVTVALQATNVLGDQAAITLTGADLTDSSAGTPADTIAALADGSTYANDVGAIRNNFASLARAADRNTADIAAIHAALVASGLLAAA